MLALKSCENCIHSMKLKDLSKEYIICKIDAEKKFVAEYCNHYWKRTRESCKNCKHSMKLEDLSKEYRVCKIDAEKKLVYACCDHYWRRRRENFSFIYDLIMISIPIFIILSWW